MTTSMQNLTRVFRANRTILVVLGFLIVWELAGRILEPPSYLLPLPSSILQELAKRPQLYLYNGLYTALNTIAAFVLATVLGIALAVAIVHSKFLENTLFTLLVALNSVPKVALAPLFVLWFGTGDVSKVAVAFLIAIFPVVVDAVLGLRSVHPEMLDLAHVLKGSKLMVLIKIRMPNSLPSIFAGMKVAVSLSLVGVIVGEFVAAKQGLGYVILISQGIFDTTSVFAAIFMLALMGTVLFYAVEMLERRLVPWHVSHRSQKHGSR
jgi:NitT/TauT family transport system permease protein